MQTRTNHHFGAIILRDDMQQIDQRPGADCTEWDEDSLCLVDSLTVQMREALLSLKSSRFAEVSNKNVYTLYNACGCYHGKNSGIIGRHHLWGTRCRFSRLLIFNRRLHITFTLVNIAGKVKSCDECLEDTSHFQPPPPNHLYIFWYCWES